MKNVLWVVLIVLSRESQGSIHDYECTISFQAFIEQKRVV